MAAVLLVTLFGHPVGAQHRDSSAVESESQKYIPLPVAADGVATLRLQVQPVTSDASATAGLDAADGGGIAGNCPPVSITYTDPALFSGGTYNLMGGMVETEIAAATYSVPLNQFPIKIELMELIFGTQNAAVQTTTQWSILVWDGLPNTGILVAEYSSDGKILPHIVLPPGTGGINVQVSVDPGDPDQIFITNRSGTGKFTVGYRIDEHNNPPVSSCLCVPGCTPCGSLPAICCPPSPASNAFPATDDNGLAQPSNNWIYARACPGATGFCAVDEGWHTFGSVGVPNDWVLRATYSPLNCTPGIGACCLSNGTCLGDLTSQECALQSGAYQGDSTSCSSVNCPIPTGACCTGTGTCSIQSADDCTASGGTFMGPDVPCSGNLCKGACCVPSTGNCVFATQANCGAVNGQFQGMGTTCEQVVCFPTGACCLPDGSCADDQSPDDCQLKGGAYQGNDTICASINCPLPEGACCVGTICLDAVTEDDCTFGFGGAWQGAQTQCGPGACDADCPGDISPPAGDGAVNVNDLLLVIGSWGACPGCDADVAPPPGGDGTVDVNDLLFIINAWGACR
jgi:hypothetical protein